MWQEAWHIRGPGTAVWRERGCSKGRVTPSVLDLLHVLVFIPRARGNHCWDLSKGRDVIRFSFEKLF